MAQEMSALEVKNKNKCLDLNFQKKEIIFGSVLFAIYMSLYVFVIFFHEPWFDELQAWQIAKSASYSEILSSVTRYEGHPALWFLLLSIPAKLGVPVEIGLKSISIIIAFFIGYFIIFKSPFSRIIKCLLPFSYFMFYQYGIITRPYSLLNLFIIFVAIAFEKRNQKPWNFVISLFLLCTVTIYGMVIAAGVAAVWLLEVIISNMKNKKFFDKRIGSLFFLLVAAIIVLFSMLPPSNSFIVNYSAFGVTKRTFGKIFYSFFGLISDNLVTDCFTVANNEIEWSFIWLAVIVSLIVYAVVFCFSSKESVKYFIVPYLFLALFFGLAYSYPHHIGIGLTFLLFWFWIACKDSNKFYYYNIFKEKNFKNESFDISKILSITCACLISVSVFWSIFASLMDVIYPYYFTRATAEYIEDNGLEDCTIFTPFNGADTEDSTQLINVNSLGVCLSAYLGNDSIVNMDDGYNHGGFWNQRLLTKEEKQEMIDRIRKEGAPDIIVGYQDDCLAAIYEDITMDDYVPVYKMNATAKSIWKTKLSLFNEQNFDYLYVRKDLIAQYGLQAF